MYTLCTCLWRLCILTFCQRIAHSYNIGSVCIWGHVVRKGGSHHGRTQCVVCIQEALAANQKLVEAAGSLQQVTTCKDEGFASAVERERQAVHREQGARLVRDKALSRLKVG